MTERIYEHTLGNGFKIITLEMPWLNSLRFDLYLRGGSRWERTESSGLAHFVEHMLFNGTRLFPSTIEHCLAAAEIGGAMNGEVDQEMTSFSFWTRPKHLKRGLTVFSSMFTEPLFDPREFELEKKIILAEIAEQPKGRSLDEIIWPGHPLSNPILGTRSRIRGMTVEEALDHFRRFYVPDNMVLVVTGPVSHTVAEELAARVFGGLRGQFRESFEPAPRPAAATRAHFNVLRDSPAFQVSMAFSFELPDHPGRAGVRLLNTLLGVSDTSRLFLRVREELGLVYSIDSQAVILSDIGLIEVDFRASRQKLRAACRRVAAEIRRLTTDLVSLGELARAKEWGIASLESILDDPESLGRRCAVGSLFGDEMPIHDLIEVINLISPEELIKAARDVFGGLGAYLLVQGPELSPAIKADLRGIFGEIMG